MLIHLYENVMKACSTDLHNLSLCTEAMFQNKSNQKCKNK